MKNKLLKQAEINTGNKLIAEFMGLINVDWFQDEVWIELYKDEKNPIDPAGMNIQNYHQYGKAYTITELKYYTSWDWLMEVVEKIQTLNPCVKEYNVTEWFEVHMFRTLCIINSGLRHADGVTKSPYYYSETTYDGNSMIEVTWKAIVKFIEWWNEIYKQ